MYKRQQYTLRALPVGGYVPLEEVLDVMVERLRDQHIRRLKDGVCSIDTGVVFLDVLNLSLIHISSSTRRMTWQAVC